MVFGVLGPTQFAPVEMYARQKSLAVQIPIFRFGIGLQFRTVHREDQTRFAAMIERFIKAVEGRRLIPRSLHAAALAVKRT